MLSLADGMGWVSSITARVLAPVNDPGGRSFNLLFYDHVQHCYLSVIKLSYFVKESGLMRLNELKGSVQAIKHLSNICSTHAEFSGNHACI